MRSASRDTLSFIDDMDVLMLLKGAQRRYEQGRSNAPRRIDEPVGETPSTGRALSVPVIRAPAFLPMPLLQEHDLSAKPAILNGHIDDPDHE